MVLFRPSETDRPKPFGFNKDKISKLMDKMNLDILIVNAPENVFYLSGLSVRHHAKNPILFALKNQYPSIVLVYKDGSEALVIWDIYDRNLTWIENTKGCLSPKDALRNLKNFIKKGITGAGTLGIESSMPFYQYQFLTQTFPELSFVIADDLLLDLQLQKSEEEIRRITESTRIAERAILALIEYTKPGISDIELIQFAKKVIIEEGAEGWDHFTMAIGTSDPEAPGTGIKVRDHELLRFDIGAFYQGYVSDVNRQLCIGPIPPEVRAAVEAIVQVQNACQKAMKPGIDPKVILNVAETTWREAGRKDAFIIMAHSLGLTTEEYHFFDPMTGGLPKKFESRNVLDLEAWTLLKGYGTVGNEDTYVVTETGCKRISTLDMKIFQK